MDLAKIRNIIFDLGGVIIDLDTQATFSGFAEYNLNQAASTGNLDELSLFLKYEKGLISSAAFRDGIREITANPELADHTIDELWNRMLLNIPTERLALIQKLAEDYRLFVLSNTNEIHVTAFNQIVEKVSGREKIDHFFEKVYYSHVLNLRKPEPEIFHFVLQDSHLRAEETLFIDDKEENILAAKNAGIITFQASPKNDILTLFSEL